MSESESPAAPAHPDAHILVVDDEPANVKLLKRVLRRAGYTRVTGSSDPREAISLFQQHGADLVLLDMRMPHLDGVQMLQGIKTLSAADEYLPVLVITAYSDRATRLGALGAGAADFVTKPIDQEDVLYRIGTLLDTRFLHRRLARQLKSLRQTEAKLRDSEERFALAMEAANEGVWDWNIRTGSLYMSRRWKAMLGYAEEELENSLEAWTARVHPEDLTQAMADLESYMDGNLASYDKTIRVRHRDGRYRWIENRWMAVRDAGGMAVRIVGTADDITEDVRLREELDAINRENLTLALVARYTHNAVVVTDADGRTQWVNPGFERLTGYRLEEVAGRVPGKMLQGPETDPAAVALMSQRLAERKPVQVDIVNYHKSGKPYWVNLDIQPVEDDAGQLLYFVAIESDISERVANQRELEQARRRAEEANRAKSAFLANMSHEIRTPLTAIIGFAEATQDGDMDARERGEAIQAIIDNGRHLRVLIDDILDLSKIEADRLQIETVEVDLPAMLGGCQANIRRQAVAKGLGFDLHVMPPVPAAIHTDPTRLKQILYNLCGNAIKFTRQGSIHMIVSCEPETRRLVFTVADPGIGMTEAQQARVFEPFVQADASTTRRFGGTGLGLSISRRLAQRLGGDIHLISQAGLGSVFVVEVDTGPLAGIPMMYAQAQTSAESPRGKDSGQVPAVRGHILLAEDNPYHQKLISLYARKTGAEVSLAENGEQAVEMALSGNYDLVLMDLQMPVIGGLEATELLRQTLYDGPIVALTAHSMIGDRDKALAAGCTGFLTKPVDWSALYQVIEQHLPAAPADAAAVSGEAPEDPELEALKARFLQELPQTLDDIEEAASNADWIRVRGLAHQLKGVAGGLGHPELTAVAASLEKAAGDGPAARAEALVATLKQAVGVARGGVSSAAGEP